MEVCSCKHYYCHRLRNIRNNTLVSLVPPINRVAPVMTTSMAPNRTPQTFSAGKQKLELKDNQSSAIMPVVEELRTEDVSYIKASSGETTVANRPSTPPTLLSNIHHNSPTVISESLNYEPRASSVNPSKPLASSSWSRESSNSKPCPSRDRHYSYNFPNSSTDICKASAASLQPSNTARVIYTSNDEKFLIQTSPPPPPPPPPQTVPPTSLSILKLSPPLSQLSSAELDERLLTMSSCKTLSTTSCKNNCNNYYLGSALHLTDTTTVVPPTLPPSSSKSYSMMETATKSINIKTFPNCLVEVENDDEKSTEDILLTSSSSSSSSSPSKTTHKHKYTSKTSTTNTSLPKFNSLPQLISSSAVLSTFCRPLFYTKSPILFTNFSANLFTSLITTCRRLKVTWPPQRFLLLFLGLLTVLSTADGECKVTLCQKHWPAYHISRSKDMNSDIHKCTSLRTTWHCIHKVKNGCVGSIEYHTEKSRVKNQMQILKCSTEGDVYNTSHTVQRTPVPPPDPECIYNGKGAYKHCGLFGDPHLRTFDHRCQTCKIEGAWSLVNNKHLIVMVTNKRVGVDSSATATSLLTVMIKRNDKCGTNTFVTYSTLKDSLPSTFNGGATHYGPGKGIEIKVLDPSKYVKIHIKYIDTVILVRHIGRYFTFSIRMPEEIVMSSTEEERELCVNGCPKAQQIDYKSFLAQQQEKIKEYERDNKIAMPRTEAEHACRKANVANFYFDSCVFDLMTTGDNNFTAAAYNAWQDLLKLNPEVTKNRRNRTDLKVYDAQYAGTSPLVSIRFVNLLGLSCALIAFWFRQW